MAAALGLLVATGGSGAGTADDFTPNDRIVSDTSSDLLDPEFDTLGNHMTWQDGGGNLWMAKVDPLTGGIVPADGKGKLIDTNLAPVAFTGNGPEWGYGEGLAYIAYTKRFRNTTGLAMVKQNANRRWVSNRLTKPLFRARPEGTASSNVEPVRIVYNHTVDGEEAVSWRELEDSDTEGTIFGVQPQGGRWIEGRRSFIALDRVDGVFQFVKVDIDDANPEPVQITHGRQHVINAFSWYAPEFDEPLFSAMINARKVGIFREQSPTSWEIIYSIDLPTKHDFVSSPEAFVVNGKSYIVVVAASNLGGEFFKFQPNGPSEIWIAGIDSKNPFFRRIDSPKTVAQRAEPEVYYTAHGPVVYYSELNAKTGITVLRVADTGLGPHLGYESQDYGGAWSTVFRDNKNCSCTPFPIGDDYAEEGDSGILVNRQGLRPTLGPEGRLYLPLLEITDDGKRSQLLTVDTNTESEVFRLDAFDLSPGFVGSNNLIDADGNFYAAGNDRLSKFTSDGDLLWSVGIRGLPRALQFAPDGNIVLFTFNGWVQIIGRRAGSLLLERDLALDRDFPKTPECLSTGDIGSCAYIDSPAVDILGSRIYVTYATADGNGVVQAYDYVDSPLDIVLDWTSRKLLGNVSSPVLVADGSRLYVQAEDGTLVALDAGTGAAIWTFDLGINSARTPVVTDTGYILPGGRFGDDPSYDFLGIVKDDGASANWAFQSTDHAPESLAAAGRGDRFLLVVRREFDGRLALVVVHPVFGVVSETPFSLGPIIDGLTGVAIREDGWVFVGTEGQIAYKSFRPIYETDVR